MKRIFKILLWTIGALIIALFLLPFVFKQEIIDQITEMANNRIDGELTIEDANLSFFRSFPKATITIDSLKIKNNAPFEDVYLFTSKQANLTTDIGSLIKMRTEGIQLINIEIEDPVLDLRVNADEVNNYNILKTPENETQYDIFGEIESYRIENGTIYYTNNLNTFNFAMRGVSHTGEGSFRNIVFDLTTETEVEDVDAAYGGIAYVTDGQLSGDFDFEVDVENNAYTFKDNLIYLNNLALTFLGSMQVLDDHYKFDISFNAPNNQVEELFSLIPNAFTQDYSNVESTGNASLSGSIKGLYFLEKKHYPALKLTVNVGQGKIKYPGFLYPIEQIGLDLRVSADQPNWKDLLINLQELKFSLDGEPFVGQMIASDIYGNTKVNGFVNGTVNLNKFSKAFPLPEMEDLQGSIITNVTLSADKQSISNKDYRNIKLEGILDARNFAMRYADSISVSFDQTELNFSPKAVSGNIVNLKIGNSDLNGSVSIAEPLSLIGESTNPLVVTVTGKSNYLDLTQLETIAQVKETNPTKVQAGPAKNRPISVDPHNMQIKIDLQAGSGKYQTYNIGESKLAGSYASGQLNINQANTVINANRINARGNVSNLDRYIEYGDTLQGLLYISSPSLDFNQLRNQNASEASKQEVVRIPKNINLAIYPEITSLDFGRYKFKNFDAKIEIANGIASLVDGKAGLFNGRVNLEGSYDTSTDGSPQFNFKYDMSDLAINRMFENSKTFRLLAPVAQYLDGVFNSTLIISGPMTDEMMPDLYRIDASGLFEILEGKVTGFKPLEVLGNTLGINELKNWTLQDSRNWFEIDNGTVFFKETDYSFSNMEFKVAGSHSIDQSINYIIKAKIPREKLRQASVGQAVDKSLDFIIKEAKRLGVKVDQGDFLFFDIFITNNLTNPKVKIVPTGAGGESLKEKVESEVDARLDSVREGVKKEVTDRTDKIRDSLSNLVEKEKDKITTEVEGKANEELDKLKDKVGKDIKEKIDSTVGGEIVKQVESGAIEELKDIIGKNSGQEIDSIKSKIKDWNPFKKNKKDN